MELKKFLSELIDAAIFMAQRAVRESEVMRKSHYTETDEGLEHKKTRRKHRDRFVDVPEKTQHNTDDYLVKSVRLRTETNLYLDGDQLKTHVKDKLFKSSVPIKIDLTLHKESAPEGVHAQVDSLNDQLKENV